jgi:hypothetical protein
MSDTELTVPGMNEPLIRYNVTVTVARDGSYLPGPAEFCVVAERAALSRAAGIVSAHTAEQIISAVTVEASDRSAAVAVALAVVSEAISCRAVSSSR